MNDSTDVIILPDATNNVPAIVNAEELTPRQIVEKLVREVINHISDWVGRVFLSNKVGNDRRAFLALRLVNL